MDAFTFTWQLLKRQTELGEFHSDLPSSHGPVKYYHGPTYRGAFVTTKPERAYRYGERKGWGYRPIPAPALIGVREGAGMPEEYIGYGDDTGESTKRLFPDDYRYMDNIDPKFLTQIKEAM